MNSACAQCAFFDPVSPSFGKCRRHAPQVAVLVFCNEHEYRSGEIRYETDSSITSEWPDCKAVDWCGEFEQKGGAS